MSRHTIHRLVTKSTLKQELEERDKQITALNFVLAVLLQEKGCYWFLSDAELEAMPKKVQIYKRRSTSAPGYEFTLEVLPEA